MPSETSSTSRTERLSPLHIRRQAIARLVERFEATPEERPAILMRIRINQDSLRLFRFTKRQEPDPIGWVDSWNPPRSVCSATNYNHGM